MAENIQLQVRMDAWGRCDWAGLRPHAGRAREVVGRFSRWAQADSAAAWLRGMCTACPLAWQESIQVARIIKADPMGVFAANVCYDAATDCCACTAFSTELEDVPLHAHCLDWEESGDVLAEHAAIVTFVDDTGKTLFISAGWPGFLGTLIGAAPSRFAISLNAVWSTEDSEPREPVGFLLRRTLAATFTFHEAVSALAESPLTCDCILLVTGTRKGEAAVIERTPTRSAIRRPSSGLLLATNHYCLLDAGSNEPGYVSTGREPFGEGSRERFAAAEARLTLRPPRSVEACFSLLAEPPFTNDLTIQRVAMRVAAGDFSAAATV